MHGIIKINNEECRDEAMPRLSAKLDQQEKIGVSSNVINSSTEKKVFYNRKYENKDNDILKDEAMPRLSAKLDQQEKIGISSNVINSNVEQKLFYNRKYENKDNDILKDEAVPRLYKGNYPKMSEISPKSKSLSVIIGSFKSICTKTFRQKYNSQNSIWQERFYDRIIRTPEELNRIRKYIIDNPIKWEYEKNNPENLFM